MAAKSRIKWTRILLCYVLLSAVLLTCGSLFMWADRMVYNAAAVKLGLAEPQQGVHLLAPGEKQPISPPAPVEKRSLICPTVAMIDLRPEQLKDSVASVEWGAQDFAALLKKVSESGVRHLAVSAPFIWEGGTQSAGQLLLCATLQNKNLFERVVLGMRGRTTAQADLTPIQFRSYVIPVSQVKGDTTQIPAANRQVENDLDTADGTTELTWAPDWIENEDLTQVPAALGDRSFPLFVRWNGEILPTLPLRLALEACKCTPDEVYAELGKEIRIGKLVLPLDVHGRVTLNNVAVQEMQLEDIIDGKQKIDRMSAPFDAAVLMQPLTKQEPAARLKLMAQTLSQLCAQEVRQTVIKPGEPEPALWYAPLRESMTWRIVSVLLVLFVAVRFIPSLPGVLRLLTMLAWLVGLGYTGYSAMLVGQWFHIGVMLVVWLVLFLAMPMLKPEKKRSIFTRR